MDIIERRGWSVRDTKERVVSDGAKSPILKKSAHLEDVISIFRTAFPCQSRFLVAFVRTVTAAIKSMAKERNRNQESVFAIKKEATIRTRLENEKKGRKNMLRRLHYSRTLTFRKGTCQESKNKYGLVIFPGPRRGRKPKRTSTSSPSKSFTMTSKTISLT